MSRVETRLAELGLALPAAAPPVANYLGSKRSGDLLFVSARVSALRGAVDDDVSEAAAREAARDTLLLLLAIVRADGVDLDDIVSIESVRGFVRSSPGFTRQPRVLDGASDLLVEIWGDAGRHARTATGAAQLPYGASVQLEFVARLHAGR